MSFTCLHGFLENRLHKIFAPKEEEMIGQRKLHQEELLIQFSKLN